MLNTLTFLVVAYFKWASLSKEIHRYFFLTREDIDLKKYFESNRCFFLSYVAVFCVFVAIVVVAFIVDFISF